MNRGNSFDNLFDDVLNNIGKEKRCSCCQKEVKEGKFIIMKNRLVLCSDCGKDVVMAHRALMRTVDNVPSGTRCFTGHLMRPTEIKRALDKYVIGQEKAKRLLSVVVYNHYKRLSMNDPDIEKSNVLMAGTTGSGKTHLLKTIAKILDVPFVSVDCTTLTESGYIGKDVDICLEKLLDKCNGDVAKAETGIVFFDEVDKLTENRSYTDKKVGGKGVQQGLLKMLEGDEVDVDLNKGQNAFLNVRSAVTINTSNILFICGGAFSGIEKIVEKRLHHKVNLGFSAEAVDVEEKGTEGLLTSICTEDLREFGMIPEFLGRLPIIIGLEDISIDALRRILVEPKNSLVSQYQKLMQYDEVDLRFEDEALDEIAKIAYEKGTGARSLRAIMEETLADVMYGVPENEEIGAVIITKDFVCGKRGPGVEMRAGAAKIGASGV